MLSVVIPSRNTDSWPYTQRTIDDIFTNSTGEIEIIVVLDGYQPNPPLKECKNLTVISNEKPLGMRTGINTAIALAKGKYVLKCDDHCAFGPGFDEILAADCEDNWIAIPSRYALNGELWERKYGPIDYLYLCYPFFKDNQFGYGFHGKKWYGENGFTGGYFDREKKFKHVLIDDCLAFQGSCWFTTKENFYRIGGMQTEGYGEFAQEAQELCFKTWLSGGRVVVNKRTWYAHLHKNSRGYHILRHHMIKSAIYSTDLWMNNKWPGQIYPLKYLIDKFWPLELWPDNWYDCRLWENYDYSKWYD